MNKKELVKALMNRMQNFGYFPSFTNVKTFIKEYEKLTNSEPEIPVVPQFVADWIEYCKRHSFTLFGCLDPVDNFEVLVGEDFEGDARKCIGWCRRESDKFARAWLDGYEVEKEKRYKVVMPNVSSSGGVLTRIKHDDSWIWIDTLGTIVEGRTHTRKELEDAGFGWIFSCEGTEVEEVE